MVAGPLSAPANLFAWKIMWSPFLDLEAPASTSTPYPRLRWPGLLAKWSLMKSPNLHDSVMRIHYRVEPVAAQYQARFRLTSCYFDLHQQFSYLTLWFLPLLGHKPPLYIFDYKRVLCHYRRWKSRLGSKSRTGCSEQVLMPTPWSYYLCIFRPNRSPVECVAPAPSLQRDARSFVSRT